MYPLTDEDRELLEEFNSVFTVKAHSMAVQTIKVLPSGVACYNNTLVYGDTTVLEIYYDGELIKMISNPTDDVKEILKLARKWKEQRYTKNPIKTIY